jgi:hypothetical protein
MTDSDPENEIGDINPPGNRVVDPAIFQAVPDLNGPGKEPHAQGPENQNHAYHPGSAGRFHGGYDFVIDISICELIQ